MPCCLTPVGVAGSLWEAEDPGQAHRNLPTPEPGASSASTLTFLTQVLALSSLIQSFVRPQSPASCPLSLKMSVPGKISAALPS